MELFAVRVWVDDLAAARAFYGGPLGLTEAWAMDGAVGYDIGATLIVEQEAAEPGEEPLVGRFVGVSLRVDDIAAAHERLAAAGVDFVGPPAVQPWGGTLAHFRDPSGNVLTLLG